MTLPDGTIKLGYKTFADEKEAVSYFANMLAQGKENRDVNEYELRALFDLIVYGHPEPLRKIGAHGIVAIRVQK